MKFSTTRIVLLALMLVAAVLGSSLRPNISLANERPAIDLNAMVPSQFGDWREQTQGSVQIINPQMQQQLDELYSQTLSRSYTNSKGYRIMLSVAYGKNQSDALQLHKPEICYPAQGFMVLSKQAANLSLSEGAVRAMQLVTALNLRNEPVTYWTVVGDHVTLGGIDKKLREMRYAIGNRIPDGMLVRVSSIDAQAANAFEIQAAFAREMVAALPPATRVRFAGMTAMAPTPHNPSL